MIIESIRKYIGELNCMEKFNNAINVNYLDEGIDAFSIEETPTTTPIIKKYTNGSTIRQFEFSLNSRNIYSVEVFQNIENSNFYEELINEIEEKNDNDILPILEEGLIPQSLEVSTVPYIISTDEDTSIYQVNFKFKYLKECK